MRKSISLVSAVSFALVAACGGGGGGTTTDTSPIKIGAITSLTGPYQTLGTNNKIGFDVAVDEINRAGGINGRKLQMTILDDQTKPDQAVIDYNQLVGDGNVAVLGPVLSDSVLAIMNGPLASKKVPLMAVAASDAIVDPVNPYAFTTPPIAKLAATRMLDYMKAQGYTKVSIVHATDNAFADAGYNAMKNQAARYGVGFPDDEPFEARSIKDWVPILTRIKAAGTQAIVLWVTGGPAVTFTKQLKAQGLTTPLILSHAEGTYLYWQPAGKDAEGVTIAVTLGPIARSLPDSNKYKKLAQAEAAPFNAVQPNQWPPEFYWDAYAAVKIVADAIKRKGTDPKAIQAGLESATVDTPSGTYKMTRSDHNGVSVDTLLMGVVKDGDITLTDYSKKQVG